MLSLMPAIFDNEVLYVGEAMHRKHGLVHVFGNSVSISYKHNKGNVLVFPILSNGFVSPNQIIQVGGTVLSQSILSSITGVRDSTQRPQQLKCKVAILVGANQIAQEFSTLNGISSLGSLIGEFYPGCQMLTCSFERFEGTREFSVLLWYKPARAEAFFLPTVSGTADSIDFEKEVNTNYWTLMSALKMSHGVIPKYDESGIENQLPFLPDFVIGKRFEGWYKNGDTVAAVEGITAGLSDSIHRRPFWGLWHG